MHLHDLEDLKGQIANLKLQDSTSRIETAIAKLNLALKLAEEKQQDEPVLKVLETLTTRTNLHTLRTSVL